MKTTLALAIALATAACSKDKATESKPTAAATPHNGTRFEIAVTEKGFEPDALTIPANKPVTLVFDRKTDQTCVKEVVITMADGSKIDKQLPLNSSVEVAATFPTAGKLTYACGMDMVRGTLTVQ